MRPLADRVVEVIADLGEEASPRYRYGSGCVVAGRTVLTSAHVIAGAIRVWVRLTSKVTYVALVDPLFIGDVDGPGPDLALIELPDPFVPLPPMKLATVDRTTSSGTVVEGCHAIGYPEFMEHRTADGAVLRETVDAYGHVPVLSGLARGTLSLIVSSAPQPLPVGRDSLVQSPWSGMSGAPVVADGRLLGVVTEHGPREGSSAITAIPLVAIDADPTHPHWGVGVAEPSSWWRRMGISGATALSRLPAAGPVGPSYLGTVREIHRRTPSLSGRDGELRAIASFSIGHEPFLWLVGDAYAGKTALLAEAVTSTLPPQVDRVSYFASRREADADSAQFLAAVVPQLAHLLDEPPPPADLHQFRQLWQRAMDRATAMGRHLLLAVDGLDEDLRMPGLPSIAAMLPVAVDEHSHVLITSRPFELPEDVPAGHPIRDATRIRIDPFPGAAQLATLARQEIDLLVRGDGGGLAAEILGLLAAAAGPLSVADLAGLVQATGQKPATSLRLAVYRALSVDAVRSLQPVGDAAGEERYQFSHDLMAQCAESHSVLRNTDYRQRVHRWVESWRATGLLAGGAEPPRYLFDSYPVMTRRDPERLVDLVTDLGWLTAALKFVGVDRVLAHLRAAATVAGSPDAIGRVAALRAVVLGQGQHLRPPYPVDEPGYLMRQLCLQAAELGADRIAGDLRARMRSLPGLRVVPLWTTRYGSLATSGELGRLDHSVEAIGVLPDGRLIIGASDGQMSVWDPSAPGAEPTELGRQDGSPYKTLVVLPDGRVVTGTDDGVLLIWNPANSGFSCHDLGSDGNPAAKLVMLSDGRMAIATLSGHLYLWDPAHPDCPPIELAHVDSVLASIAALPDGRLLTGGYPHLQIWDVDRPDDPVELAACGGSLGALVVLPDGRVASELDGLLLVWDPTRPGVEPRPLGRREGHHLWAATTLPDGRLVTGGPDNRILIWNPAAPGVEPLELGRHDEHVRSLAVLPDGRVVSGGGDGRILLWDPAGVVPRRHADDGAAWSVTTLPDCRIVTGGQDGRVLMWDPAAAGARPTELARHEGTVWSVDAMPDGRVISGGSDGRVLMSNVGRPNRAPVEVANLRSAVLTVAALPIGWVVTGGVGGGPYDGQVVLWDCDRNIPRPVAIGRHSNWVRVVVELPDTKGRVVSGGDDGELMLFRHGETSVRLGHHDNGVRAIAVLPDGRVAAGGGDGRVLVWDTAAPGSNPTNVGQHSKGIEALAVLPDGRLISGSHDGRIRIWNSPGWNEVAQIACPVSGLASVPHGAGAAAIVIAHQGLGLSYWLIDGD
jgi:WD40 repeat protein